MLPHNPLTSEHSHKNTAIRYPVTVGSRVYEPRSIAIRDIAYVMHGIRSGIIDGRDLRADIAMIRSETVNEVLRLALKRELMYFCPSLCERKRSNKSVTHAQFIVFDLDHVADIEGVKLAATERLPFIRWAFRSVRDGVKLVAMLDRPITDEEEYRTVWQYLAMMTERALELEVDRTPDWSRACFFSHDPDLLLNPNFMPLNVDAALEQAPFALKMWESTKTVAVKVTKPEAPARTSATAGTNSEPGKDPEADFISAEKIVRGLARIRMEYRDWIKAGLALHSGFGDRGKELWDIFLDNPHYKDSQRKLDTHWRSFRGAGSVTLASLFYLGEKYGIA